MSFGCPILRDAPERLARCVGLCDLQEEERNGWQAWGQADGGAKEIEAPTLARRSLPGKGIGHTGTTRKEWVKAITPLTIQLSGGVW